MKSHYSKWLPAGYLGLYTFLKIFIRYLAENMERFGMGVDTVLGKHIALDLFPKATEYFETHERYRDESNRTPALAALMQECRNAIIPVLLEIARILKSYPPTIVTPEDLVHLGLPPRSTGERHPSGIATLPPDVHLDSSIPRRLSFSFFDASGTRKKGKPAGQHGVEIRWILLPSPSPAITLRDLTRSSFDTRSPYTHEFEEDERGHILYFALRWENTRGEKGPFGEISSHLVP
jgi:hypothetical protein